MPDTSATRTHKSSRGCWIYPALVHTSRCADAEWIYPALEAKGLMSTEASRYILWKFNALTGIQYSSRADRRQTFSFIRQIMLAKLLIVFVLFFAVENISSATFDRKKHHIDIRRYNASYYDPKTGVGLKAELEDSIRNPLTVKIAFRD
ncbi:uncharacterized protein LOC143340274 [Colletes latitarsis]|uniref:uncharacterized protein LOC143340274 n=1 Tax=Colletes latitarsis TaxID=2605962 RepID=UPI00403682AC